MPLHFEPHALHASSIKPQRTQRTQRQRTKGTWACSCGGPRLATRQTCKSRTYRSHDHDTGECPKRFAALVHTTIGDLSYVFLFVFCVLCGLTYLVSYDLSKLKDR